MTQRGQALCCLLMVAVAYVDPPPQAAAADPPIEPAQLDIPQTLGYLSQVPPAPGAKPPTHTLLLIQDAHADYEAQQHIAAILDRLASQHGIKLVLVEGGEGDVDLSFLQHRADKPLRQQIAERYLQAGLLSGEEYLDIVSEHELTLWGVDDLTLYDQAVARFLAVERIRRNVEGTLAELHRAVERLRERMGNESVRHFESQRALFAQARMTLNEYLDVLTTEAEQLGLGVTESRAPHLERLLHLTRLERELDLEEVQAEQGRALAQLRLRLSAEEAARLLEAGKAAKADQQAAPTFYQLLGSLMARVHLDGSQFPHLHAYIQYLALRGETHWNGVWPELQALEQAVRQRLLRSREEAELAAIADGVERLQQLVNLQWSPGAYASYREHGDEWRISRWLPTLRAYAAVLGVDWSWQADPDELDQQLQDAVRFYDTAAVRDAAMVERALEKMDADGASVAALIVGGFHTEHLSRLLTDRGVRVVVITPLVGSGEDEERYRTLLRVKYEDRWRVSGPGRADRSASRQSAGAALR